MNSLIDFGIGDRLPHCGLLAVSSRSIAAAEPSDIGDQHCGEVAQSGASQ
jgi:hypothetical protein